MRITVVIPAYNSGRRLERAVNSAFNQTRPPLEIVCVDDCSSDGTWETIQRLAAASDGRIVALRHEKNQGCGSAGRNTALKVARGEWIALLDHDDYWLPEKLERQATLHESRPDADLLHTDGWEERGDDPATRVRRHALAPAVDSDPIPAIILRNFVVASSVIVRKEAIEKAGGFTVDRRLHGANDIDAWLRLALRGARFAHVDEPLAVKSLHRTNMGRDRVRSRKARLRVYERRIAEAPRRIRAPWAHAVKETLMSLRLELISLLLKEERPREAARQLRELWRTDPWNPRLWRLRLNVALAGLGSRSVRDLIDRESEAHEREARLLRDALFPPP